jgi:phosphoglycerate dehydrogenase-like enzyme
MTRIAVLDDWQDSARRSADWSPLSARADVEFFRAPFDSEDAAAAALKDRDIVLATRVRSAFPRSLWSRLPRLARSGMTGARAGLIDIAGMIDHGITVCYTDNGPSLDSTAELSLALMLAAARGMTVGDASVRAGTFQVATPEGFVLAGKTIGLLGIGRIGAKMATYCNALDMRVLAWSPNLTDERASAAGATRVDKHELLRQSDVVSLHMVLSERSRGLLGADELALLKRGAIVVNTARAGLIDEAALVAAVEAGRIVAALDVFWQEPLRADHPLTRCANTVLAPHLGYSVREVYDVYYRQSVENALAFLDGKPVRVLAKPAH